MEEVKAFQKKLCSQALLAAIGGALVLIVLGEKAVGKGLILGTLFSAINFVLMAHFLGYNLAESRTKASAAALGSILIRFAVLSIPLIVSLRLDSIHVVGVIVGIFMVQLIILYNHVLRKRTSYVQKS
jgi:hypothetical protein